MCFVARLASRAAFALMLMLSTGCMGERVFIRPSEIPKVSGTFTQPVPVGPNATMVRHSITRVEREDGLLADFAGNIDLVLVLRDGQEHVFEHPLSIVDTGPAYEIRSGNHALSHVLKTDIARAAVQQGGPY